MTYRNCKLELTDIIAKFLEFYAEVRMIAQQEEQRIRHDLSQAMKAPADTAILEARLEKLLFTSNIEEINTD